MYMNGVCIGIRLCVYIIVHGVPFASSTFQWGEQGEEEEDEEEEIEDV